MQMSRVVACGVQSAIAITSKESRNGKSFPAKRGRRLSIIGLWQPMKSFVYSLVLGSFKTADYIKMLDVIAQDASKDFQQTGRMRVIVQDNGSILHFARQSVVYFAANLTEY